MFFLLGYVINCSENPTIISQTPCTPLKGAQQYFITAIAI